MKNSERLLSVRDLRTSFFTERGEVKAVDGVSFYVDRGEVVAIVGESGCGKSMTQMSILQLIPSPPGKILGGEVLLNGESLLEHGPKSPETRAVRGGKIAMIFQEPMTSLNPVIKVGKQLTDVIRTHKNVSRDEAWNLGVEALKAVGIPDPGERMKNYPFEMSGGMRQRVMIAMAVACGSELIIADEPTTALDVTTQAQVMELLISLVRQNGVSLIVVTHNLGLVTRYADRIYVMYAGRIVESGTCEDILTQPQHPYTVGLLRSVPKIDGDKGETLAPIPGSPPDLAKLPVGCAFMPRCVRVCDKCRELGESPALRPAGANGHMAACCLDFDEKGEIRRG